MRTFLIAFFFTCLSLWAFAQDNTKPAESVTPNDSILFNNGKVLATHVIDTTGDKVTIEKPNSSKHKKIEIDRENIFSVRYGSNHKEVVMYIYDTLTGHDFSQAKMNVTFSVTRYRFSEWALREAPLRDSLLRSE